MADICPNINVQEWKNLVAHVGEFEAYRAYMAHGNTIPNAISISQLKKEIGLGKPPYSPERQVGINQRIRRFNLENGTSHRIAYKQIGQSNSYTAQLRLNYLPVNLRAQKDRDARRKMQGYTKMEDGESFKDVYIPSESEQEAGQFNEEGDFLPPSASVAPESKVSDAKERPKFQTLINEKQRELDLLYGQRSQTRRDQKKAKSQEEIKANANKLARINAKIRKTEEKIVELSNLNQLDQIGVYAEEDMETLNEIFSKDDITLKDLEHASRLIRVWQKAGDFSGDNIHIFYDVDEYAIRELGLKQVTDKFIEWKRIADGYEEKLIQQQEKILAGEIKTELGDEATVDFNKAMSDVNFLVKNLLDISEVDNVIFQATASWVKRANDAARKEMQAEFDQLDTLIKATGLTNFDDFRQTFGNDSDQYTGEMVDRFSQSFFDWKRKVHGERRRALDSAVGKTNRKGLIRAANQSYGAEMKANTIIIDPRILFYDADLKEGDPPTDEEITELKKQLTTLLGPEDGKAYKEYVSRAKRKVDEYKVAKEAQIEYIESQAGIDSTYKQSELDIWVKENSPYVFAQMAKEGVAALDHNDISVTPRGVYTEYIPKSNVKGKSDGFYYDNKFKDIESDPDSLALHTYMMDLLQRMRNYLPTSKIGFMQMNSIPTLKKKVMETMMDGGVTNAFTSMSDLIAEGVRSDDLTTYADEEEKKDFQFQMLVDNRKTVNDYIQLESDKYRATNNGEEPSAKDRAKWRRTIMNQLAEEKSFDLGRVMKAFASMAITYQHRSSVEEQIRTAQEILERGTEERKNAAGDRVRSKWEQFLDKPGLDNLKDMYENFLDVAFWGYPRTAPEFKTKKKKLTSREKKVERLIDEAEQAVKDSQAKGLMSELEAAGRLEAIKQQRSALGGVVVGSNYGDAILKYIQIKGMGWNGFAAISNLGFGLIANLIEASDGRNYSIKSYRRAMKLAMNSVGRNWTFNKWDGVGGDALKIRALMDYYDTLKETKNEIYRAGLNSSMFRQVQDTFEFAKPYNLQSRTEYLNQAPVMIAMLLEEKVVIDGKETTLWDAYEIVDGKPVLPEGLEFSNDQIFRMKQRIDKVVKMNHGNYDPDTPVAAKRKFIGRAALQFRTWALQGFHERFGAEKTDYQLVDRQTGKDALIRKGRYRSLVTYYQENSNTLGWLGTTVGLMPRMFRHLVNFNTSFNELAERKNGFTEVDAANMRKNLTEMALGLMILALVLAMKNLGDEDDENVAKRMARNLLINQMSRLATDIMFYFNPIEFERLSRNAIPAFTLVIDGAEAIESGLTLLAEGEDVLQSGPNKGESRFWRDIKQMTPFITQVEKAKSAASQIYKR